MRKNTHAETHSAKALRRLAASAAVLLAVCLVLMTPVSAAVVPDTDWYTNAVSGVGDSEDNPYVITTAEDLFGLARLVSPASPTQQQEDFTDKYIKLVPANGADSIDLQEVLWTPIGVNDRLNFNGTFIGNGKTIKGLNVSIQVILPPQSPPSLPPLYAGLFGYIGPGGSVTNLTVIGEVDVTGDGGHVYAGGIAGQNGGVIAESSFHGTVNAENDSDNTAVGGIAGMNAGTIRDCYTTDAVTANGGMAVAGGIAGANQMWVSSWVSSPPVIQNCYATGDVSATSTSSQQGAPAFAGGIAGYSEDGTIQNCYALNKAVAATGNGDSSSARVVGLNGIGQGLGNLPVGNYGWKHMFQELPVNLPPGYGTYLPSWNAADCCAADIQSASWDSNIWTMTGRENYKLPVLKNSNTNPSETPAHLLVEVTFNAIGGTPTSTTQKVLDGAKVTKPTLTPPSGKELEGWYKEPAFTTKWIFDQFIVCPPNFTLYANWTSTDTGDDDSGEGNGGDNTGGNDTGGDNTVPGIPPANNNNGGGGGGSEGTYDTYPRNTDENGDADFGKSPVVIRIDLPEDTDTAVTLITNPDTPETPDTEDTDVYYEFELDIPDYPEETEGDVIWRIPKSLLNDEFGADDYGVYVYDEDEWKPLDSVWEEGDGNYLHYTTKITGDGNFIIVKEKGISKKAGDDTPVTVPEDKPQDTPGTVLPPSSGTETPDEEEQEIPILGIGIGLLILVLVIAGIVFAVSRRK